MTYNVDKVLDNRISETRLLVVARLIAGDLVSEIAKDLQIPADTVRQYRHRYRKQIQAAIGAE